MSKNQKSPKSTPQSDRLAALFNIGKKSGLWAGQRECSDIVKLYFQQFRHALYGAARIDLTEQFTAQLQEYLSHHEIPLPPDTGPPKDITFKELYERGKGMGLWETQVQCADVIGICSTTINRFINKNVESVCSTPKSKQYYYRALGAIWNKISLREKNVPKGKKTSFSELFHIGITRGLWKGAHDCSLKAGMDPRTVSKYADAAPDKTATVHHVTSYEKACKKLAKLIADAGITENNQPASSPVPPSKNRKPQATPAAEKTLSGTTDFEAMVEAVYARIVPKIVEMAQTAVNQQLSSQQLVHQAAGVTPSNWVDEVIAGRSEFIGQNLPGVRFVLTTPPFQKMMTRFTDEEIADTQALIDKVIIPSVVEVRRRLNASSQTEGSHGREVREFAQCLNKLAKQVTLLLRAAEQHREMRLDANYLEYLSGLESLKLEGIGK